MSRNTDKDEQALTTLNKLSGREATMREKQARAPRFMARDGNASRRALRPLSIIVPLSILALAALPSSGEASGVNAKTAAAEKSSAEFTVYALSRGKGVPEPTRSALSKARTLLEGARQRGEVIKLNEARVGLEGETRLCVEAKDVAAARALLRDLRAMGENIELFNVVVEPCPKK